MSVKIEPLTSKMETAIRKRLDHNPFVKFMGIEVPRLGQGFARFVLKIRPEFHNSQGFLQGGVITALADEAVAYALFSLVRENEMINTVDEDQFLKAGSGRGDRSRGPHHQAGPHHFPRGGVGQPGSQSGG